LPIILRFIAIDLAKNLDEYLYMVNKIEEYGLFGLMSSLAPSGAPVKKSTVETVLASEANIVRVVFDNGPDAKYDYALPQHITAPLVVGQRVRVPFGRSNRSVLAFCEGFPPDSEVKKLKHITEIVDNIPFLSPDMVQLAYWMSDYYCCPLGAVFAAMVPAAVKKQVGMTTDHLASLTEKGKASFDATPGERISPKGKRILQHWEPLNKETAVNIDTLTLTYECSKAPINTLVKKGFIVIKQVRRLPAIEKDTNATITPSPFSLTADQQDAFARCKVIIEKEAFGAILMHGITGSGKTEVYMRCLEQVIATGRQGLILVPEIALTPQTVARFTTRFSHVAVLHSALSQTERHRQWQWIKAGKVSVVVGARSAIFAPLSNLGIIIVDEEHEPSYKQDTKPRYHGRDVAIKRAHFGGIPIILGSATPSLETYQNALTSPLFHLVTISKRVANLPLPKVTTVDMRIENKEQKNFDLISGMLAKQIKKCLENKKQAILLLNRRGHSNYVFCPSCSFGLTCPNCDVSLTCHKKKNDGAAQRSWVMCHHCLHATKIPKQCPVCAKKLIMIGPGTQKVEEELNKKFPNARLLRIDSDAVKPADYHKLLGDFEAGNIDILMGTQMIAKGLDFPNVDLVGIINADTSLSIPDFRSSERTFQLITQVAGRCGRKNDSGRVIVQSYLPDELAIQLACEHDYNGFAKMELDIRKQCKMPPFMRMARIVLRDKNLEKAQAHCVALKAQCDKVVETLGVDIKVRGPMPATIARLESYHRWQVILLAPKADQLGHLLNMIRLQLLPEFKVQTYIDVDPINLM